MIKQPKIELTQRQVHLDFHTSPLIEGIGEDFNKEDFQKALKEGHLTSITVFAKCHHGMCYFPTKVGNVHPYLKPDFDFTGAMVDAAHEIGVKAPIYITGGWSANDAATHPEWCMRDKDGKFIKFGYREIGDNCESNLLDPSVNPETMLTYDAWIELCLNDGSYAHHIYEFTEEVCKRYKNIDGLFYDICFRVGYCMCDECKAGMKKMGLNPDSVEDAKKYFVEKHQVFQKTCGEILHQYHPNASIYFNSGAEYYNQDYHEGQSHFEMEDLPTDWGGYDKMPARARYFSNSGKDYLGMTGKFHTSWGEFGGFKCADALKFEVALMTAYGAKCSIGDQMHPRGFMEHETYKIIGEAYSYIEKIEPYVYPIQSTAKVGLYLSNNLVADEGVTKMLLETQTDFDVVYEDNYDGLDIVIFPDYVKLKEESVKPLEAFIKRGGKVIFTGESLLNEAHTDFLIDAGIKYLGAATSDKDFVLPGEFFGGELPKAPLLYYKGAERVSARGAEVLSQVLPPYFNRTVIHYCSHKNTPFNPNAERIPGMTRFGNVIYIAHPVFTIYKEYGSLFHKRYFQKAMRSFDVKLPLEVNLMSAGRGVLNKQEAEKRYVAHFFYAPTFARGKVEALEDFPEIHEIPVTIRVPEQIKKVRDITNDAEICFERNGDEITFVIPKLRMHELVVLEY